MRTRRTLLVKMHAGFTLVELIMVIVITGIIAGMISVFIARPVTAYVDTVRRAEITENADTAIRRMARDLRTALPNSVRVVANGTSTFLEFIPTVGGGRYRQYPTAGGGGNVLDFSDVDSAFDVLGPVPVYAAGNSIVLFNLGAGSASDAYTGNNRAALTSSNAVAGLFSSDAAPHTVTFAAIQFSAPSPSARFLVVDTPVTYECAPNSASPAAGVLNRYSGYSFASVQPQPPANVAARILVGNVAECDFDYNEVANAGLHTRTGLVTLRLRLQVNGESARLVHQMQVVKRAMSRRTIIPAFHAARGFALVSAIFLLVILAALAAFIVQVSTQQQVGAAADIQGARAYQAARAGVEWGVFNHLRNSACATSSSFAPGGNLSGFTVTVQCLPAGVGTTNEEDGTVLTIRRIVATACNQPSGALPGTCPNPVPGANYIEREIAVVAGR